MHFDALSLACVVAELQRTLAAGRIQQLLRVDSQTFGFEIYTPGTRHQLLVALHPGQARLQTVSYKLRRGADPDTPLLLLLRKYGRGAQLAGIEQPDPCERLVRLALAHPEHGATTLVLELIGHRPNVLLLNPAGRILECLHHQTERADRLLQPGRAYVLPSPPAGLPPFDDGSEHYFARLAAQLEQPGALWKALVAGVAGLSPTAAREVAWRVHGDAGAAAAGTSLLAVAQALQELWAPLHTAEWCPGTVEEAGKVVGFAAYPLQSAALLSASRR
ncbi:MAG: NFACT family protein [Caldilinea sp.]